MTKKFLLLTFLIIVFSYVIESQNIGSNIKNINVGSLTNTQMQKIISEIEKRGLSEEEAVAMATAYGLPASQVQILQQRIRSSQTGINLELQQAIAPTSFLDDLDEASIFVQQKPFFLATEEEKRVFGFHLFNSENLTFEPSVNIPVSPKYVIGSGDAFVVDIYGASMKQYALLVNKNGEVTIPEAGVIQLGGVELEVAEKRILAKLSTLYKDLASPQPRTFANISLEYIKSINISVIGEAFIPGTYTLPGTATAFNALYYAGGPNYYGSFREIQVIRGGEIVALLDVYDYLIKGNGAVNVQLRDGDVILIPTYKKRIRVGGNFIRTGIFESKEGESFEQFIRFTGGFSENAYQKRIELHRNTGKEKELIDLYQDFFTQIETQSGDSIYAGEIIQRFSNRVTIEGAVFRPGSFELTENLTLNDLIAKAEGIREDAFMERGLILRLNEDLSPSNISFNVSDVISGKNNISLKREDVVTISSIDMIRENRIVSIQGSVQRGGEYPFREKMTLGDIIVMAGGFLESASESYIEVTRRLSYEEAQKAEDRIAHLFQFTVPRTLALHSKDASFELKPFDQVFVRNAPGFVVNSSVYIGGEVNYPGHYGLTGRNERLSQLIQRAGGLSHEAYETGAMLTRTIALSPKEKRLQDAIKEGMEAKTSQKLDFAVIGVNLEKALKDPGGKDDIFLRDGDELIIPRKLQTINIGGEVLNPLSMPYIENKNLKYYVNQSGGFGVKAHKGKSYVVYPNGTAAATKHYVLFRRFPEIKPGSQIIVPTKIEKDRVPVSAWVAITGSLTTSTALIIVAVLNNK